MIKPVNGHLIIEPIVHDEFIASQNSTFQEIGTVVAFDEDMKLPVAKIGEDGYTVSADLRIKKGDKVYFDSWLAAKYPKADSKDGEFYWLVKWEDVRAIEHEHVK